MKPLLLTLGAILALVLPVQAEAQPYLTVKHAEAIVIRAVGPGTTITSCGRLSRTRVDCGYSTPSATIGLETENPAARFYSSMVV
jgi:hypothetical protein